MRAEQCFELHASSLASSTIDRFWAKVHKTPTCWLWTSSFNQAGYGTFHVTDVGSRVAHKVSWLIHNGGSLHKSTKVLHKCDNPPCVNPDHLILGSQGENNKDMCLKGRNPRAKITPEMVLEIRRLRSEEKLQHQEIADRFGLSRNNVTNILNGKRWGYVTPENLGGFQP